MKAIILSLASSCSKIIYSFQETEYSFQIFNTEIGGNYKFVPDNENNIPIAVNIYNGLQVRYLKIARYFFAIPLISRLVLLFWNPFKDHEIPEDTDLIFCNWGGGILPELNLFRSHYKSRKLKIVLNLESFPTSWSSTVREKIEIFLLKRSLQNIDGVIITTHEMRVFFQERLPKVLTKKTLLTPFFFPKTYFKESTSPLEVSKDLFFLGRFNESDSLNDVGSQISELSEKGISISAVVGNKINTNNIFHYPLFKSASLLSGDLHELAHSHKAALVTYNLPSLSNIPTRFSTSLPHRLLMPIALGLPIVLPKGYFLAMENFVIKNQIGLAYSTIEELYDFLNGDGWKKAKENIRNNQSKFQFDPIQFQKFYHSLSKD